MKMWEDIGFLKPPPKKTGLEDVTFKAYENMAHERWQESLSEAPHGKAWHTSFHASRFPGGEDPTCDRKAMYEMMGIPASKPAPPFLIAIADAGKDIEVQIMRRWHAAGKLLTAGPDEKLQTGFEDPDTWLTCSLDAALDLSPDWEWVLPTDVKSKDHSVVEGMIAGMRGPDAGHVRQLMVQVHFCRERHEQMGWDKLGLKPAKGGSLLYVSRNRPMTRCEFYYDYDEAMMHDGLAKLARRKQQFIDKELAPRPAEWLWTQEPCKWCDFKRVCKADIKADVNNLGESKAIEHAQKVTPLYDFDAVHSAVLGRWSNYTAKEAT